VDYPVGEVGSRDVSVDMMMCAMNPADINQIQGMMLITTIF
jgi:NADPH:quinone reductase-like Zn-dependent oxidoreductase